MNEMTSIQQRYFSDSICFGCGPMNEKGLGIRSYEKAGGAVSTFVPDLAHRAADGIVCGGIISTVLDCHAAGMAWLTLVDPPSDDQAVVTKEMTVRFLGPTPVESLELWAEVVDRTERRATIRATLAHDGVITADLDGVFVRVPKS